MLKQSTIVRQNSSFDNQMLSSTIDDQRSLLNQTIQKEEQTNDINKLSISVASPERIKSIQPPSNQYSQVKLKKTNDPLKPLNNRSNLRERGANHSVNDETHSQYSAGVNPSAHGYHSHNQNSGYLSHAVATDNESARVSNIKAYKYNGHTPASNASGPY